MKQENPQKNLLPALFGTIFLLSASTFGGGFVIISLMKKKVVEKLHWLEEDEMLDITAIAQSAPGSIQVNASVLLGYRLAGIKGAVVAVIAAILPPLLLLSAIACFYDFFRSNPAFARILTLMRVGVAAVICDVVINLAGKLLTGKNLLHITLMLLTFIMVFFLKIKAIYIILLCLGIGIIHAWILTRLNPTGLKEV